MKNKKFTFQKGQTLMEILIYVAIFGIVAASLVGIVWNVTKIHSYQLASNEVDSNLRYAMNLISDRIRGASSIESAASSTLVLKMPNNTTTTFNVIDGVLYIQEGSADPVAVISDRVVVSRDGLTDGLTFEKIDMAGAKGGARVTLTLSYVPKEGGTTSLQRTLLSAVTRSATAISFSEDIVPGQDASYSVGSASYNWKNGYFSGDVTVNGTLKGTILCIGSDCKTAWPSGGGGTLTGTGTINKVAKWTSSTAIGDSIIYDNGTSVGIGTASPLSKLSINGGLHVGGDSDAGDNNILADGTITGANVISTGNVGFHNNVYSVNVPNPIWSFGNATTYGLAYYQGTALAIGDAIGFHFGNVAVPKVTIAASGTVTATQFAGGGAGITGVTATNADTVDSLHVHTSTNNEANKIVRTDVNGYIQAGWINSISGDNGSTAISRVYASSDAYIRYYSLANFAAQISGNMITAPRTNHAQAVGLATEIKWRNYGNSHTIVDNSDGGYGGGNTQATYAWSATYPLLVGYNGSSTYGVRVDSARVADSASSATYATYINTDSYNMKLHWSGQGGQPTWLWGSNDGANSYVWNPSNFSVAYAASAGNADTVDGYHASQVAFRYTADAVCPSTGVTLRGAFIKVTNTNSFSYAADCYAGQTLCMCFYSSL